jgi:xanthine dehydrogenase accessory factor
MSELLHTAALLAERGERAALATVIRTAGSTPRHAGAKMIVTPDGTIGTIGGGRIEHEVVAAARTSVAPQRLSRHLVKDLAMCCGGEMEVWIEPLDAARGKALGEAFRRARARIPCALLTSLDPARGGKDVLPDAPAEAILTEDRFVEPIVPADRVVLFGAGHVAHALAPMAARVGFDVVVCDEDAAYASAERFPDARVVDTLDPRDLADLGAGDHVVILTRDHAVDQAILERLLPRADLAYLGMIGSRGKLGRFRRRLDAKGIGDEAAWARLRSPVGLEIGAETPEEIAVAIVGELIAARSACRQRR